MKKFLFAFAIFAMLLFSFTNIYATNLINNTTNINPYMDMDMNNNSNNMNSSMENAVDGLTIGIIVASIATIAGVVFFYLIPKE